MSDAFNDLGNVTRSHIPAANTLARTDVPHVSQQPVWEGRTVPEGGEAVSYPPCDKTKLAGIPRIVRFWFIMQYWMRLRRSLYGLKQSGRMWYNRMSEYLTSQGYGNNELCPCVFIKKSHSGFTIIAVYVDDMNLIETPAKLEEIVAHLKSEFEIKDLGKTWYHLSLEIKHCSDGILVHQSNYTQKVLRHFNEDKAKPSSTHMVIRTLDAKRDPFYPKKDEEEILEPEVSYLGAIGALIYLAQCTRPNICFAVNLLVRYSNAPTRRHWNGVKDIFRYLKGTTDLTLFYTHESSSVAAPYGPWIDSRLVGYADAGYLSDPHRTRSQMGYVFIVGDTAIFWRSTKQTLVTTSSNHAEILALHEASRECFWLREVMGHIRSTSGLTSVVDLPTTIFEDNAACIEQLNKGYIKGDNTKHIAPKFFYSHQQ
ncbi:uncharacterized mitochondrial protein AtMg00810-like [Malus domestica]|uniref:uncharacterized mitochondrial protein AtMg00810-like n=1 Tax=Malus domestica TaxID=3750 RepID=UPI003975A4F3